MVVRRSESSDAFLGRDDEAELMPVIAPPLQESVAILHVALGRIDLALRAILGHAVPFEVTQMRVHCPGADKLPSAGGSALRVELHHAGLHRDPARPRAHPVPVPAPRAPILEARRCCRTPAPRVEPAASIPRSGVPLRIAAGAPDRPMDLTDETGRASTRRADPARGYLPATTDRGPCLDGYESRLRRAPSDDDWKSTAITQYQKCSPRDVAWKYLHRRRYGGIPFARTSWATALGALKEKYIWKNAPLADLDRMSETVPKQCADKHLGAKFR